MSHRDCDHLVTIHQIVKSIFYYLISCENADAELDSIIQISLDLQEAQKARGNI